MIPVYALADLPTGPRSREFVGDGRQSGVSVIVTDYPDPGGGPRLHTHPYSETFFVIEGRALFVVGDETAEVEAGSFVVAPAGVPHKFTNLGPGRLFQVDIHDAPVFATDWLE